MASSRTFNNNKPLQNKIALDQLAGADSFNKFAFRTDLTAAGGEETIWATTGNFTPLTSASTFDIAYDGTAGGSTDGAGTTGATVLTFFYIDSNGLPAISTHTLGTDGTDTTSFSGLGINRVAVSANGGLTYNASDITVTATTGGTKQAIIPALGSTTQQAIYFVGSSHRAVAEFLTFNVNKLSGSNPKVTIKGYAYNRAIDTRFEVYRHIIDTQTDTTVTVTDPIGFPLSPTDVLYFVADTDQNNTVITLRFSLNEFRV